MIRIVIIDKRSHQVLEREAVRISITGSAWSITLSGTTETYSLARYFVQIIEGETA